MTYPGPEDALVNDANAFLCVERLVRNTRRVGIALWHHRGPYQEQEDQHLWHPKAPFQAALLGSPLEGWGQTLPEALVNLEKELAK